MKENCVCVLVTPKKYQQILEEINNCKNIVIPEKYKESHCKDYIKGVEILFDLPVIISTAIDEDIKYVTKEEYEEIRKQEIKQTEEFFKNYEPDYMWK